VVVCVYFGDSAQWVMRHWCWSGSEICDSLHVALFTVQPFTRMPVNLWQELQREFIFEDTLQQHMIY
jgi:hypothetical protein